MKFRLEIEAPIGSETTSSRFDVAWLLDGVARRLRSNNTVDQAQILDTSDNVVGGWVIEDEEQTNPFGIPIVPPKSETEG